MVFWPSKIYRRGKKRKGLVECRQSTESGFSPLVVGFIFSLKDPHGEIWFDSGNGYQKHFKGGETVIFNRRYGFGGFTAKVMVVDSNRDWEEKVFKVCVDESPKGELIVKFFQGKAAGHVAEGVVGSGLQVDFTISSSVYVKQFNWNFGDKVTKKSKYTKLPNIQTRRNRVAHYTYVTGRKTPYKGSVEVIGDRLHVPEKRKFSVIMKKLEKGKPKPKYFTSVKQ